MRYDNPRSIYAWLEEIKVSATVTADEQTVPTAGARDEHESLLRPNKRRRLYYQRPLTPPRSRKASSPPETACCCYSMSGQHPFKRPPPPAQREDDADTDFNIDANIEAMEDMTPRAVRSTVASSRKRVQTSRSRSNYSLSATDNSSTHTSQRSGGTGASSPRKQLKDLARGRQSVHLHEWAELREINQSPGLRDFLDTMDMVVGGVGIVPESLRGQLEACPSRLTQFGWTRLPHHFSHEERDKYGISPPPEAVLDIMEGAVRCSQIGSPEATWNKEVHQSLLQLALRPPGQGRWKHLVNFLGCTTATPLREYVPISTASKKVDFAIFVDPINEKAQDSDALKAKMSSMALSLPSCSFNHTDDPQFQETPIALGIETKKTGEDWTTATLQLAVWQSAHWCFLRRLAARRNQGQSQPSRSTSRTPRRDGEDITVLGQNDASFMHNELPANDSDPFVSSGSAIPSNDVSDRDLLLPDFIPGLIIQGHDWHLVITTAHGEQTRLWHKMTIGSTSSTRGIYQIILALQVLKQWVDKSYWPWMRELILDV